MTVSINTQARRTTYPAGRILHMVPAYLLLGEDALFEEYQGPQGPLGASLRLEGPLSDEEDGTVEGRGGLEGEGSMSRGGLRPEATAKVQNFVCVAVCGNTDGCATNAKALPLYCL